MVDLLLGLIALIILNQLFFPWWIRLGELTAALKVQCDLHEKYLTADPDSYHMSSRYQIPTIQDTKHAMRKECGFVGYVVSEWLSRDVRYPRDQEVNA